MQEPTFGQASLGAVVGAAVAATGGLLAAGVAQAIADRSLASLFATPRISLICWIISGPVGWFLGGQIGPRLGRRFQSLRLEIVGGVLGGLIPVILIALWCWHMVTT